MYSYPVKFKDFFVYMCVYVMNTFFFGLKLYFYVSKAMHPPKLLEFLICIYNVMHLMFQKPSA